MQGRERIDCACAREDSFPGLQRGGEGSVYAKGAGFGKDVIVSKRSWTDNPRSAETIEKIDPNRLMKVVPKTGWFWRVVSYAVTIVTFGGQRPSKFMDHYATTFAHVVAVPPGWSLGQLERVLPHERRHVEQARECGLGFLPLGILVFGFLYFFVFLPVGFAYFRYRFECDAELAKYRYLLSKGASEESLRKRADWFAIVLSSGDYFWCWPLDWVYKRLHRYVDEAIEEAEAKIQGSK